MPRGDGTGPWGAGPMSGRGAGFCGGARAGGFMSAPGRRGGAGMGFGGGGGRGWRNWFRATGVPGWIRGGWGFGWNMPPGTERSVLEGRAQALQDELNAMKQRLDEIGGSETTKG